MLSLRRTEMADQCCPCDLGQRLVGFLLEQRQGKLTEPWGMSGAGN